VGALWASSSDAIRLEEARSSVLLIGGYDGSGNYGDVAQLLTALKTVRRLPGSPQAAVVIEGEMHAHHDALATRYGPPLSAAVVVQYIDGERPSDADLVELGAGAAPRRSALYLYGGGHLNRRWGARKVTHAAAVEHLALRRAPMSVVASGLQLDEAVVAPGGVAHDLLARASWIGVRDPRSLGHLAANLPGVADGRAALAGDDAVPLLSREAAPAEAVVNLHLNDGIWVSDDPRAMAGRIAALVAQLGRATSASLELQPVIAYEDWRVSERRLAGDMLDEFGEELERAGLRPVGPVDILEDAIDNGLARFRRARFTVSCSYHVTLTSLMAGIPALLLAENDYYEQKAAGLRELFGLDRGLIGSAAAPADAEAAAQVLVDGPARTALVAHLRTQARAVVQRYERGRAEVAAALVRGLGEPRRRRGISRLLRGA
jgi:polysaccharide pyruvyl transferase WcaK-like protein